MLLVGLTGGLGSGKSTVSRMLDERGAVVLDADGFARDAVRVGSPGYDAVIARFGQELVADDGELDRARLASIVFNDEEALRDLEAIVHPFVRRMVENGIVENSGSDRVVILVNPLLIEMGTHRDCDVVVVVSASPPTQLERVVARGMDPADAEARMAMQMPLDERAPHADVLLDNEGTLEELERQVERLWTHPRGQSRRGRGLTRRYPADVRFRAVLFDAGETLVHPAPSFPELFSKVLAREGHDREPAAVLASSATVFDRFSAAARDMEQWTTSPARSRAFWTGVYERMSGPARAP